MTKKVAIVGAAPSSRELAPYEDESWEIWSLNFNYKWIKRWSRHFDLHKMSHHRDNNTDHWQWMAKQDKPIYLQQSDPALKSSVTFPYDDVVKDCGGFEYFTNSVSYMLALAIHEQVDELALFGCDMAQFFGKNGANGEYSFQRPSCEFYLGVAVGKGIKVTVASESDLLKKLCLYGYETIGGEQKTKLDARRQELRDRVEQLNEAVQTIDQEYRNYSVNQLVKQAACEAAIAEHKEMSKTDNLAPRKKKLQDTVADIKDKLGKVTAEFNQKQSDLIEQRACLLGALEESEYMRQWQPLGLEETNEKESTS